MYCVCFRFSFLPRCDERDDDDDDDAADAMEGWRLVGNARHREPRVGVNCLLITGIVEPAVICGR